MPEAATFRSVNPASGALLTHHPETGPEEVEEIVVAAERAHRRWRTVPVAARIAPLRKAADLLRAQRGTFARLMATEMGKPLTEGLAEIDKCAVLCEYTHDHAPAQLAPQPVDTGTGRSQVRFEPLGPILAIMPWNFPVWQVLRGAVPCLAAGNAVLVKPAPNVAGCALAVETLLHAAGVPRDLYRTLLTDLPTTARVIAHPLVQGVTLTGSVRAGREVAALAGAHLKKTVLELGGSDPYVVLGDADLDQAVEACVASRLSNAGQTCLAAKRIIVVEALRRRFEEALVAAMGERRTGDPLDPETDIGPLARADLRANLHRQVAGSVAQGATCRLGGSIPDGEGFFYPPTVLTGVRPGMPVYHEEVFGPVASVIAVPDEEEAIRVANDTSYGLGAVVFTRDRERGECIAAERLAAGSCFVNAPVRSDPRLPFGGIKNSGYGRELSAFGIREFVNIKAVCVT